MRLLALSWMAGTVLGRLHHIWTVVACKDSTFYHVLLGIVTTCVFILPTSDNVGACGTDMKTQTIVNKDPRLGKSSSSMMAVLSYWLVY